MRTARQQRVVATAQAALLVPPAAGRLDPATAKPAPAGSGVHCRPSMSAAGLGGSICTWQKECLSASAAVIRLEGSHLRGTTHADVSEGHSIG